MTDILGAVAAATQLAANCMTLLSYPNKISGSSSTIEKYQDQLKQLIRLSQSIAANPFLQTDDIAIQVACIAQTIVKSGFAPTLRKGLLHRAWMIINNEAISELFSLLERQKSNLLLTIESLNSTTLHEVRTVTTDMAQRVKGMAQTYDGGRMPELGEGSSLIRANSMLSKLIPRAKSSEDHGILKEEVDPSDPAAALMGFVSDPSMVLNTAQRKQVYREMGIPPSSVYWGNMTDAGMNQVNGRGVKASSLSPEVIKACDTDNVKLYMNNLKLGEGDQTNGLFLKIENPNGALEACQRIPESRDIYCFNYATGSAKVGKKGKKEKKEKKGKKEKKRRGTQYNGTRLVFS
ncbi:hypothetical protein F5Y16DRAFT_311959 [Xylariaceae sp. FL0255]|nr:hypothetical protein F5Y16DRAFT_311959 [Xylariaceae sp. FL0255]